MRFFGFALAFTLSALTAASALAQQPTPAKPPAAGPDADLPPPPPPAVPPAAAPAPAPAGDPAAAPADGAVAPAPAPDAQAPAAEPAPGAACVPECRSGYTCQQGVCISACNPPCAAGEQCTAAGECVVPPGAGAPPAFFDGPPPPPEPREGAETHDGFMLRFTIGFGGSNLNLSGDGAPSELDFSGFSTSLSFDVGGAPIENLVLHGRLAWLGVSSPNATEDGDDTNLGDNLSAGAILIAPAVSYYLMPINIYFTGAVGLSFVTFTDEDDEDSASTNAGLGLNLDVGKEWWVVDNWGFGVTGRFWYTSISNSDDGDLDLVRADVDYTYLGFALLFSATYQ